MEKPKMMPEQTPYTDEELVALYKAVEGAAIDDPGEQDEPVQWLDTTEKRYHEMLECLPPAAWIANYFLVGEPLDHYAASGRPRYAAYGWNRLSNCYVTSSRPMTIKEFKEFLA